MGYFYSLIIFLFDYFENKGMLHERTETIQKNIVTIKDNIDEMKQSISVINKNYGKIDTDIEILKNNFYHDYKLLEYKIMELKK